MKATAFDFDGTLIDSMGMWRHLGRNFVESKGKVYTDAIHEKVTTMSLKQPLPLSIALLFLFGKDLGANQ